MSITSGDAVALTRELVRVDSRNPTLVAGAPGEGRVARVLADVLSSWGFHVDVREAAPGRPNVIARVGSALSGGRTLMFNGHIDVVVHGRAAHGSKWDVGVDAIRQAGLLLAALDALDAELLPSREHTLLGRPSLHASTIEGGIGLSTYPDRCHFTIERRTIPGESTAAVMSEIEEAFARVRSRRPELHASVSLIFEQPPSDVPIGAPIVRALDGAMRACGED